MSAPKIAPNRPVPAIGGGEPLFTRRFPFICPTLPEYDKVLSLYKKHYASGMITNANLVARFEAAASERLGVRHCIAVSSCTSGLMLVLKALGVRGDVILPSFTFFATGHAVLWNGLRPVFADCDPYTWTVDTEDVESRITEATSAILAVHLYGNPAAIEQLERLASKNGLKLVFDAAHAFGSTHNGRPVGQFGDAEVFSLSPTKLLVAGEGGLVCTNDATLAALVRAGRNYGDTGQYDPALLGLNARMTEFNAGLALAGLDLVDQKVRRHNQIAQRYTEVLADVPGLQFQEVHGGDVSTYKDFSVLVWPAQFGMDRDEAAAALLADNIETKKYFSPPLHRQRLFREVCEPAGRDLNNTERISNSVLSLPIYESLSDETVEKVAMAVAALAQEEEAVR